MALLDELEAALGDDVVLTGDQISERYRSDESHSGRALPFAVLRPATVEAVSQALAICDRHCQSVVPQGGLTGLAGGANPRGGDIALSLERFTGIEEIDAAAATMTVRAGTPLEVAQQAAEKAGFLLPIDLGSRGSCQIGGNIATNAGGIRVIRHGVTRDNVLGLEAVIADGTILSSLNKTMKNNTGYDLRQLFIGSEGTLGIITRAVLKLKPLPSSRSTALCAATSYEKVVSLLRMAKLMLANVSAFEVMWDSYFRFNAEALGLKFFDVDHPFLVIVEEDLFGNDQGGERFEAFLAAAFEEGLIDDALIAQSEKEARNFWSVREGYTMDKMLPSLVNLDISMAIGRIGDYAAECGRAMLARFPGAHVSFFGHIGDSNLHVTIATQAGTEDDAHTIDEIAYDLVRQYGGSISAEHGIGTLKRDYLGHSRSPQELAVMRHIKAALDPNGILNPGKVLPPV
ncbi:FAD/FMN-containing dehydrogenase [Pararhizobium capsulatum DSM 1112]|uniref:FAD/FMN-containing dehydrogenase n=1 Tax=Pararhizobium capsulatum DSM 1112 TaxID=1121113 RepID=A0ABU0BYN6_9HYPH|nr:FAD-binding oxidoreductase [Pararhizobium capsulatum]MDQ0322550.1 FAD/FMN-containing dehydrogenase [Pararhizobium capsulatum DSM 1112]